jgi:hypothetical protein
MVNFWTFIKKTLAVLLVIFLVLSTIKNLFDLFLVYSFIEEPLFCSGYALALVLYGWFIIKLINYIRKD